MEMLLDDATDTPQVGKWYYFEYDPKFKDQLGEWDEFPLVKVLEKKNDIYLGANLHYLNAKARLSAINTDKYPNSSYIIIFQRMQIVFSLKLVKKIYNY